MTITQAFLTSEISNLWPDNTTGAITPVNARTTLNDIVTAIFQGISPTGLSTTNTWTATQTITLSSGTLNAGLNINLAPSGTSSGQTNVNAIMVTDTATITGGQVLNSLWVSDSFGGSSAAGGRQVIIGNAFLTA